MSKRCDTRRGYAQREGIRHETLTFKKRERDKRDTSREWTQVVHTKNESVSRGEKKLYARRDKVRRDSEKKRCNRDREKSYRERDGKRWSEKEEKENHDATFVRKMEERIVCKFGSMYLYGKKRKEKGEKVR